MAEIVKHFAPRLVEIHNYSNSSSNTKKKENWTILNRNLKNDCNLVCAPIGFHYLCLSVHFLNTDSLSTYFYSEY